MKCDSCKKNETCFYDGIWGYCEECVKTKEIDKNIHESELVEWNYCEYCKNIVRMEDFIGSCEILLACKQRTKNGFTHLCKECATKHDSNVSESKTLTSCMVCTSYLKKIRK